MQLKCSRSDFETALAAVMEIVPRRSPKPATQYVLLSASPGACELIGTDEEVHIGHLLRAECDGDAKILFPPRRLAKMLPLLRTDEITISSETDIDHVEFRSGDTLLRINPEHASKFKEAPVQPEHVATLDSQILARMARQVVSATDQESVRYALGGALLEAHGDGIRLVASDSRRLAIVEHTCGCTDLCAAGVRPIVPAKMLNAFAQHIGTGDARVFASKTSVEFRKDQVWVSGKSLQGKFPKYDEVVPASFCGSAEFRAEAIRNVMRHARLVATETMFSSELTLIDGMLQITHKADDHTVETSVAALRTDVPGIYSAHFNPRFFTDFLDPLPDDAVVRMQWNDSISPALLSAGDCNRCLIMPSATDEMKDAETAQSQSV